MKINYEVFVVFLLDYLNECKVGVGFVFLGWEYLFCGLVNGMLSVN